MARSAAHRVAWGERLPGARRPGARRGALLPTVPAGGATGSLARRLGAAASRGAGAPRTKTPPGADDLLSQAGSSAGQVEPPEHTRGQPQPLLPGAAGAELAERRIKLKRN